MSKYDNLLRLGGAEVFDVRDFFKRHKYEIKKKPGYEQLSDFEYTIVSILELIKIDARNVEDYDLKFVIRKKEP